MTGRIIIVEDEGLIALHIAELLVHAGFGEPEIFSSGEDVLAYFARFPPPDIVLMDIGLAGTINGIETARRIRTIADTPIIFLTAYSDAENIARASAVSPSGYLVKPVGEGDLLAAIRSALSSPGG